ncbi:MAG: rod shape-determining protein MreD [Anaerovoracaceae bacterium]|jgi:rod shape-determining protein MreD
MKYRYTLLLFFLGLLIQSTLMVHFRVLGVTPNIVLCFVTLLSFLYEGNQGVILGVICGLLQDLFFSVIIGPAAIAYFIVALVMEILKRLLYRDSILSIFFASLIGTFTFYIINWGIVSIFGGTYSFLYILKKLPILAIYHFVIMLIFYLTVGRKTIRYPQDRYYKKSTFLYYE